jgi:hypothetical protein
MIKFDLIEGIKSVTVQYDKYTIHVAAQPKPNWAYVGQVNPMKPKFI